ncbi:MAG: tRNA pseudouridine(13) synthase TruD [Planctomycetota bacterium]|nr:MAG: tRNA pseudouridine(13) synthase TruD [Planctomycetota bacterium]
MKIIPSQHLDRLGISLYSNDLPGTDGHISDSIESFKVTENPLYEPSGEGEHFYYCLKKQNRNTMSCVKEIAKTLNIPAMDIGYAGLKDKFAITEQQISIRFPKGEPQLPKFINMELNFLGKHINKIKTGHLAGNQFEIKIDNAQEGFQNNLDKKIEFIESKGLLNYLGDQRFGNRMNNHLVGIAALRQNFEESCRLILGDPERELNIQIKHAREHYEAGELQVCSDQYPPYMKNEKKLLKELLKGEGRHKRAFLKGEKKLRELFFNAAQAYIFNHYLSKRFKKEILIVKGDVALLTGNLAPFLVEDPEVENKRLKEGEITIGGPLLGPKMFPTQYQAKEFEDNLFSELGLQFEDFKSPSDKQKFQGARRPILINVKGLSYKSESDTSYTLKFTLPPGCYATILLNEILNPI